MIDMNLVTPKVGAKHELLLNNPALFEKLRGFVRRPKAYLQPEFQGPILR
jgi:hypothetical protein